MRTTPLRLIGVLLGALLFVVSMATQANCTPAIDALNKAWKQDRIAQYSIRQSDEPLTGQPFLVRIGKFVWTPGVGSALDRHPDPGSNPMVDRLQRDVAKGTAKCEPLGNATYRNQVAVRYRLEGTLGGNATGPLTLWIGASNGLPIYHQFEKLGLGGFAWIYGESVKEPK